MLNLTDLIQGINPELQAEMAAMQATKKKGGGKSIAPFSDEEQAHVRSLVAACLLGHVSQRDIIKLYKECVHKSTDAARAKQIKDLWFAPIASNRTGGGFEKKFVELYKEISAELERKKETA